ncbi:hypothetical protein Tcan_00572, partial [Toxocara canis]
MNDLLCRKQFASVLQIGFLDFIVSSPSYCITLIDYLKIFPGNIHYRVKLPYSVCCWLLKKKLERGKGSTYVFCPVCQYNFPHPGLLRQRIASRPTTRRSETGHNNHA